MDIKKILSVAAMALVVLPVTAQVYPVNKEGNPAIRGVVEYIKDKDNLINKQFDQKFGVNSSFVDFVPGDITQYVNYYSGEKGLYKGRNGKKRGHFFVSL